MRSRGTDATNSIGRLLAAVRVIAKAAAPAVCVYACLSIYRHAEPVNGFESAIWPRYEAETALSRQGPRGLTRHANATVNAPALSSPRRATRAGRRAAIR